VSVEDLRAENEELRRRLEESEETVRAIREGAVDAFVVAEAGGNRIYTLEGADRPYRLFVERMQEGAVTLHSNGVIAYSNLRFASLLGVPQEKLMGARMRDLFPPGEQPEFDALLREGQAGTGQRELHLDRSHGPPVPVHLTVNVLPKDCGAAMGVLITDLTAQKHQEKLAAAHEALRESEERYRSLVSVITDVPWTADPAGAFVAPQSAWTAYTGQTRDEYAGFGWLEAFHPDDRGTIRAALERAADLRDLCVSRVRVWNVLKQEYRYCEARGAPLLDPDGSIRAWVGACTDVHERVQAEAELREAGRRKDHFLAMLAHELRNPLTPIQSAAHVMRKLEPSDLRLGWASDVIERQVRHLSRLVDDLLDVSRIAQGKIELKKEAVDLSTAVASAVEANGALIDSKKHQLTVDVASITVLADMTRLTQILSNLLNNAAKYTREGGRLSITARKEGREATIKIRDDGPGIPAGFLSDVFELFAQGERSLDRAQGGLGIGLTIVKSLVELHEGRIEVASEEGKGTEFTVTLPVLEDQPRARTAPPPGTKSPVKEPRKVLVVDDNVDGAEALTLLLRILGHDVRTSFDGPSALEVAREFVPDVVLLDIGLPGMNGYEVASRLRQIMPGKPPLLVAMTGYGQEEDKQQAYDAGFDLHLTKPLSGEAVEMLLERS
jgi:two-component system CheB/CheR fusion protein